MRPAVRKPGPCFARMTIYSALAKQIFSKVWVIARLLLHLAGKTHSGGATYHGT